MVMREWHAIHSKAYHPFKIAATVVLQTMHSRESHNSQDGLFQIQISLSLRHIA